MKNRKKTSKSHKGQDSGFDLGDLDDPYDYNDLYTTIAKNFDQTKTKIDEGVDLTSNQLNKRRNDDVISSDTDNYNKDYAFPCRIHKSQHNKGDWDDSENHVKKLIKNFKKSIFEPNPDNQGEYRKNTIQSSEYYTIEPLNEHSDNQNQKQQNQDIPEEINNQITYWENSAENSMINIHRLSSLLNDTASQNSVQNEDPRYSQKTFQNNCFNQNFIKRSNPVYNEYPNHQNSDNNTSKDNDNIPKNNIESIDISKHSKSKVK